MAKAGPSAPIKPEHFRTQYGQSAHGRLTIRPAGPRAGLRAVGNVGGEQDDSEDGEAALGPVNRDRKEDGDKDDEKADNQSVTPIAAVTAPPSDAGKKKKKSKLHPQERIDKLWKNFDPEYLGKATRILPEPIPTSTTKKSKAPKSQNAAESYREARAQCEQSVRKIIDECLIVNQKYTDVHFDLERDLKVTQKRDCIDGLVQDDDDKDNPTDVKRVTDLFDDPKFYSEGAGFDDIIQGATGDCWMMSAFSVLSCSEHLIRSVCVVQDQDVGVYGFVFFRDGEWHPTIIDDKLYLSSLSFDESINTVLRTWGKDEEQKYTELFQRGSKALYFARCRDDNETWVPLLEKALAKAHGGYDALRGGQTGEAIEDLTGGVTTEIYTTNILSKDKFWNNELRKIGRDFMFDATDPVYREWQGWDESEAWVSSVRKERRKGVVQRHAYAVLDTYEGYGERLVKVRNPWGEQEWSGPWADGSSQWTSVWLERLNHKFGDDGVFWMSYKDFLNQYKHINGTRIFDDSWYTSQQWASIQVPFSTVEYQQTKFIIDVPEETETVIVLSQLDSRYFQGLEGKYAYRLQFRVSKSDNEDDYIARSKPNYELNRSTNVELRLKQGTYTVLIKVTALDYGRDSPEEVIKANLPWRKEKVTTIGRLYDLAHQKGLPESEDEKQDDVSKKVIIEGGTQTEEPATDAAVPAPTPSPVTNNVGTTQAAVPDEESDSEGEDGDKDPWNATCVVGLRVYSKQPELGVKVVWPPKPNLSEAVKPPAQDRDAITKAPQEEAEKKGRRVENVEEKEKKKEKQEEYAGVMASRPSSKPGQVVKGKREEQERHGAVQDDEGEDEGDDEEEESD